MRQRARGLLQDSDLRKRRSTHSVNITRSEAGSRHRSSSRDDSTRGHVTSRLECADDVRPRQCTASSLVCNISVYAGLIQAMFLWDVRAALEAILHGGHALSVRACRRMDLVPCNYKQLKQQFGRRRCRQVETAGLEPWQDFGTQPRGCTYAGTANIAPM